MEIDYKGYRIRLCSRERANGAWAPQAEILWSEGGQDQVHPIGDARNHTFPTQAGADAHAAGLARAWIDHHAGR